MNFVRKVVSFNFSLRFKDVSNYNCIMNYHNHCPAPLHSEQKSSIHKAARGRGRQDDRLLRARGLLHLRDGEAAQLPRHVRLHHAAEEPHGDRGARLLPAGGGHGGGMQQEQDRAPRHQGRHVTDV